MCAGVGMSGSPRPSVITSPRASASLRSWKKGLSRPPRIRVARSASAARGLDIAWLSVVAIVATSARKTVNC